jgi:hypothetical protein
MEKFPQHSQDENLPDVEHEKTFLFSFSEMMDAIDSFKYKFSYSDEDYQSKLVTKEKSQDAYDQIMEEHGPFLESLGLSLEGDSDDDEEDSVFGHFITFTLHNGKVFEKAIEEHKKTFELPKGQKFIDSVIGDFVYKISQEDIVNNSEHDAIEIMKEGQNVANALKNNIKLDDGLRAEISLFKQIHLWKSDHASADYKALDALGLVPTAYHNQMPLDANSDNPAGIYSSWNKCITMIEDNVENKSTPEKLLALYNFFLSRLHTLEKSTYSRKEDVSDSGRAYFQDTFEGLRARIHGKINEIYKEL